MERGAPALEFVVDGQKRVGDVREVAGIVERHVMIFQPVQQVAGLFHYIVGEGHVGNLVQIPRLGLDFLHGNMNAQGIVHAAAAAHDNAMAELGITAGGLRLFRHDDRRALVDSLQRRAQTAGAHAHHDEVGFFVPLHIIGRTRGSHLLLGIALGLRRAARKSSHTGTHQAQASTSHKRATIHFRCNVFHSFLLQRCNRLCGRSDGSYGTKR